MHSIAYGDSDTGVFSNELYTSSLTDTVQCNVHTSHTHIRTTDLLRALPSSSPGLLYHKHDPRVIACVCTRLGPVAVSVVAAHMWLTHSHTRSPCSHHSRVAVMRCPPHILTRMAEDSTYLRLRIHTHTHIPHKSVRRQEKYIIAHHPVSRRWDVFI